MKVLTKVVVTMLVLFSMACDDITKVPRKSEVSSSQRPSYFTRKKECAEIGYQYFQRSKSQVEAFVGKAQADKWVRNGPLTTYSPERDSCLVAWTEFVADKDVNGKYFQIHAGYLYDALTNEDLASYGYSKNAEGVQNTETMTEEQYKRKVKELMGISQP